MFNGMVVAAHVNDTGSHLSGLSSSSVIHVRLLVQRSWKHGAKPEKEFI